MDLGALGTTFATFNIADSFLTVGMILFVIYIIFFFDEKKDKKQKEKVKSERDMTTAELNGLEISENEEAFETNGENSEKSSDSRNG